MHVEYLRIDVVSYVSIG
jgi:hypothetical protein